MTDFYNDEQEIEEEVYNDDNNEIITEPFDPAKIDISMRSMTLDLLIKRIKENEIALNTKFQRKGDLWRTSEQSRLIESLMVRIPLPAFYFDGTDDNEWLIVDGLQRLTTLKKFVVDKNLQLTNLEFLTQYNDFKFDDLPRQMQRRIEETQVTVFIINPGTPPEVKFNIFRRINTGGLTLEPQEIRHALNQGFAADFLEELAELDVFKEATCYLIKSDRMQDREMVLRFLAFTMVPYTNYTPDLENFLNNAMINLGKTSLSERKILKEKFIKAMDAAIKIFDNDAFRKRYGKNDSRKPINKALFEAWSVILGGLSNQQLNLLRIKKNKLISMFIDLLNNDKSFDRSITTGTSQSTFVQKRFKGIENIVQEVLK
ncbi:DUF262 domain-containing protein [Ectobacillus funiculus]|uniref:DUF262 domain-containing protein n=1 Tax=Ectobacillus funiculus TaxID=137993 RepID=UPI00101B61CA|nr:DUF262 domain-containing protein [Ectobacillus funiculus]